MKPGRSQRWHGLLPWIAAGVGLLAPLPPAAAQPVWELTPYRIQILVALGTAPELTPRLEADLIAELASRIDLLIGPGWDATVASAPRALRPAMLARIDAIAVESLAKEWLLLDKVMLVAVLPAFGGYQVAARELDVRTRTWNRVVEVPARQSAKLGDAAFRAVRMAFAPLAKIETVDREKKAVTLRLRAAALPPRDKAIAWVAAGDVFQPLLRRNDREGKLRGVAAVPWTYLVVEGVTQAELKCQIHSGVPGPLSARRRARIEQLALAVIPPGKPTRLKIQARTEPRQPLVGYDVYEQTPDSKPPTLVGRSDRKGNVIVQPTGRALRVLLVKHGGEVLARLPLVPGLPPEAVASIPNDDLRLEAEQLIIEFQERLVDLVIRRELLLAKARASLAAKKPLDQVEAVVAELNRLEKREELMQRLSQQQERMASNDAAVQKKIKVLFDDTRKLLEKHLNPDALDQVNEQLAQARSGAKPAP